MAIIKQDTFTEGSPPVLLSAHTSDVGAGYQGDLLSSNYEINPSGTLNCSQDGRKVAYGTENPGTADYEASVIGSAVEANAANQFGVIIRASGGGESACTGYAANINGAGNVQIERYDGGAVRTAMGSVYAIPGFVATNSYTLRLRAVTNGAQVDLTVYVDDAQVNSHSDADAGRILNNGNGGVYSRYSGVSRAQITSLLVEDLAGTVYSINGDTTVSTTIQASMQYVPAGTYSAAGVLVNKQNSPVANLNNINWYWMDNWGTITDQGTTSTDGSGNFSVSLPGSARVPPQEGYITFGHESSGFYATNKMAVQ